MQRLILISLNIPGYAPQRPGFFMFISDQQSLYSDYNY